MILSDLIILQYVFYYLLFFRYGNSPSYLLIKFLLRLRKTSGINAKFLNFVTKNPSRFIATMLLGNNISLVIYGIFMGDRIIDFIFPEINLNGTIDSRFFYSNTYFNINYLLTAEFFPKVFLIFMLIQ